MQISNTEGIGNIPGLRLIEHKSFSDPRGYFAEVWNEADFEALNLPFLNPKQTNVAVSEKKGVTRGLHAEPWDKLIWVTKGKVFSVWLDLREGDSYGRTETKVIEPGNAVWVPRGVANGYQTLEEKTVYNYLTNGIWSPDNNYISVNLRSLETLEWPVSLNRATISEKDMASPMSIPIFEVDKVVFGSDGRIGKAIARRFASATKVTGKELRESSDNLLMEKIPQGSILINCVGMTSVDYAETAEGFSEALEANSAWVSRLANLANETHSSLIHFSSDYVFDGKKSKPYTEQAALNPISKYGISKALGDYAAMMARSHFILRFSWLLTSEKKDFLEIVKNRFLKNQKFDVVNDQFGIPTFVTDVADAVEFLCYHSVRPGVYNLHASGEATSWHGIAVQLSSCLKSDPDLARPSTSQDYFSGLDYFASRPPNSVLDMSKLSRVGYLPKMNWQEKLRALMG